MRRSQSGQVMVLVAVSLIALIGSAALVLVAGSAEWQKDQLQQLADQAALDSALKIGIGCDTAKATAVITEADNFLATQRTRTGSLSIAGGACTTPYNGTDTFASGLSETINYPYRAHQQQVEVILALNLPISFGGVVGKSSTTVIRRAVAQQLAGSMPAVSATTLTCNSGQVNIAGSVVTQNAISLRNGCALYTHARFDATSGTFSDLGDVRVYADRQTWIAGGGRCAAGAFAGSRRAICADGVELSGHVAPACGSIRRSAFLSAADALVNPNPCAGGVARPPVPPLSIALPPEPNRDPAAIATLVGNAGAPCSAGTAYPVIRVGGAKVGTGLGPVPAPDASGFYHFRPSCYGYLDLSQVPGGRAAFDPGFYYFNGSGFAGGGGVCLNGAALLMGRDVTMEFVNRAGMWTTACGGGSGVCGANTCSFGSKPCSKQACPPNILADAPSNFAWLAAPCSAAPSAADASSCPGSVWCPVGDRACWNLLVWAPAGVTGRFLLDDPASPSWLLGSIYFSGSCSYSANATSQIAGTLSCASLSLDASGGNTSAVGGEAGINTALAEAILVE
ncbi:MAG: hypothetical protein ACYDAL_01560 [Candidatus Dormibacteraceae bacterium]